MREFKAHVEGLRAFAVLPILVFHLSSAWCPGGFVGVDIFFVISGYLITGMILADGGRFSFRAFYARRLFRLFPALIAVLAGTLIAGWHILSPADYERLALSAMAATIAVSNIFFFAKIDYFDASALAQPLLHTWSLGVEEQFYLLWPAIVVMWLRRGWSLRLLFAGTVALSLGAMFALQSSSPGATFYLMPLRMFELGLGALILLIEPRWRTLATGLRSAAAWAGLLLLAGTLLAIDSNTPWPGLWTLPCVIATALLVLSGASGGVGSILANPVPRLIGRISYSVYLVHWPLISLYRAHIVIDPSTTELVFLGIGSLLLGALVYAIIEVPFRLRKPGQESEAARTAVAGWLRRPMLHGLRNAAFAICSAAVLFGSAAVAYTGGVPSRLDRGRAQFVDKGLTFAGDLCNARRSRCAFGDLSSSAVVYLIGDSHALNLVHGLDGLLREWRIKGIALYDHGCLFAYGTKRFLGGHADEKCARNVAQAYELLAESRHPVIIGGDYAGYRGTIGPRDGRAPLPLDERQYYAYLDERFDEGLKRLDAAVRPVVLIKQTFTTSVDLAKCLAQPGLTDRERQERCAAPPRSVATKIAGRADALIDGLARRFPGVVSVDPKEIFCRDEICSIANKRGLFLRDHDHLTNEGSEFLIGAVRGILEKSLRR